MVKVNENVENNGTTTENRFVEDDLVSDSVNGRIIEVAGGIWINVDVDQVSKEENVGSTTTVVNIILNRNTSLVKDTVRNIGKAVVVVNNEEEKNVEDVLVLEKVKH